MSRATRGPVPFRDVFIHAMIQDGEGRKMSKSLGNGVDPLDIIASHGADALRFALCQMTTHTQDIRLPVTRDPETGRNTSPKFDAGRNFCNKLWNAARFALTILTGDPAAVRRSDQGGGHRHDAPPPPDRALQRWNNEGGALPEHGAPDTRHSLVDRWMLSRLEAGARGATAALDEFRYSDYAQVLYDLLWRDFCDWYLEAIKPTVAADPRQRAVLAHSLETIVRLLHPVAPFVTEAIWESLREIETEPVGGIDLAPSRVGGLLASAGWPRLDPALRDEEAERGFERLRALVTAVREVRAQQKVQPKRRIVLHPPPGVEAPEPVILSALAGLSRIEPSEPAAGAAAAFLFEGAEWRIGEFADAVDAGAERERLTRQIADLEKSIRTFENRLSNPGYTEKAPPAMVQQTREQLDRARAEASDLRALLRGLGG